MMVQCAGSKIKFYCVKLFAPMCSPAILRGPVLDCVQPALGTLFNGALDIKDKDPVCIASP